MSSKSCALISSCDKVIVLVLLYTLITVVNNVAVLRVIWKRCRRLYHLIFHYMILATMALSNILLAMSILVGFFALKIREGRESYRSGFSRALFVIILPSLAIPVLNAAMLAVNRCILCETGIRYRNVVSKRKMILSIIGIWVLSYAAFAVDQAADPKRLDNLLLVSSTSTTVLWVILSLAAIVLIFVSNARTFFLVKNKIFNQPDGSRVVFRAPTSAQVHTSASAQPDNLLLIKRCVKLTSGTVFICLWYSLTMIPFTVIVVLTRFKAPISEANMEKIQRWCSFVLCMQGLFDPIIYSLSTKEIRKGFKKEWKCFKEWFLHFFD